MKAWRKFGLAFLDERRETLRRARSIGEHLAECGALEAWRWWRNRRGHARLQQRLRALPNRFRAAPRSLRAASHCGVEGL